MTTIIPVDMKDLTVTISGPDTDIHTITPDGAAALKTLPLLESVAAELIRRCPEMTEEGARLATDLAFAVLTQGLRRPVTDYSALLNEAIAAARCVGYHVREHRVRLPKFLADAPEPPQAAPESNTLEVIVQHTGEAWYLSLPEPLPDAETIYHSLVQELSKPIWRYRLIVIEGCPEGFKWGPLVPDDCVTVVQVYVERRNKCLYSVHSRDGGRVAFHGVFENGSVLQHIRWRTVIDGARRYERPVFEPPADLPGRFLPAAADPDHRIGWRPE